MIRAVIIEDEEKARMNLASLLKEYCPQTVLLGMAGSVAEGLGLIEKQNPELVFLDVKMRGETGFDLLERLEEIDFSIIFTTAHDEFAIKAFHFNAVDYLLKPINIEELQQAVARAEIKATEKNRSENINALLGNLRGGSAFEKIALPTLEGLIFVRTDDIIRCEASDNYTTFHIVNSPKIMVSKTIKHFEELLIAHNFFRVHQTHLINLNHIKQYYKGEGGYVKMSDGSSVMVARRKKDSFLKKIVK